MPLVTSKEMFEKAYKGVDEKIIRTKSGDDLVRRLNAYHDRLLCSLIHKFGKKGGETTDKAAYARKRRAYNGKFKISDEK